MPTLRAVGMEKRGISAYRVAVFRPRDSMRGRLLQALAPIVAGLLLLLGVVAAGRWARGRLQQQDSFSVAFADIDCVPPEGLSREDFLGEVQFLADYPDRLPLLDPSLPDRLARAFAAHPWVEEVKHVEVLRDRGVWVELEYRRAVLAVCLPAEPPVAGGSVLLSAWSATGRNARVPCRAVDKSGVLLPARATHAGLPLLHADVAAPTGAPGTPWGDARVRAAAAAAAFLEPHRQRLGLSDADWEAEGETLILSRPGLRILWGRAPGLEGPGEASAAVKLKRLREYSVQKLTLAGREYDVRPAGAARHRTPAGKSLP
jgi:hypothetical protein